MTGCQLEGVLVLLELWVVCRLFCGQPVGSAATGGAAGQPEPAAGRRRAAVFVEVGRAAIGYCRGSARSAGDVVLGGSQVAVSSA